MSTKTLPSFKSIVTSFTYLADKAKHRRVTPTDADLAQRARTEEIARIKDELASVRREIDTINSQFNDASEPECIAYYAYLLKATEAKYDYLLRLARELAG